MGFKEGDKEQEKGILFDIFKNKRLYLAYGIMASVFYVSFFDASFKLFYFWFIEVFIVTFVLFFSSKRWISLVVMLIITIVLGSWIGLYLWGSFDPADFSSFCYDMIFGFLPLWVGVLIGFRDPKKLHLKRN